MRAFAIYTIFILLGLIFQISLLPTARAGQNSSPPTVESKNPSERVSVRIEGMACPFCAYGIEKQLRKIPGVKEAEVDFKSSTAALALKPGAQVTEEQIEKAVKKAGFKASKVTGLEKTGGQEKEK